ncbi:MAG TPA: mechanosensitive ion channel domain-containing protein [Verrucomicrobiae bacterium]|jgi:small conductance mechanosensitive channel|nr:mechanosensitive ion channel domain-containing protein [Verrucomicrobiae bacterium]
MQETAQKLGEYLALYGVNILAAAAIFLVGKWAVGLAAHLLEKALNAAKVDATVARFAKNLSYIAGLTFVALAALARMGIETASFIAVLGAAGLAVGLALQGSLSNFAAGVLIVLFKPYKVGHAIEAAGITGTVEEVQIFDTVLNTADNVRIIIPNSQIMGNTIKNYSCNPLRRVDLVFGVGYSDDLKKVRDVIEQVLLADSRVLRNPAPLIAVKELAAYSVNFAVRVWAKAADYWDVYFALTENMKLAFDKNGITIPFPMTDVRVLQQSASTSV